ncbi:MAG: DUF2254 domain-containing protein [Pirellulaceae bacterium]
MRLKARAMNLWENTRSSYWFVPSLMCLGAIVLNTLTLWADREFSKETLAGESAFYTGSAEGARSLLSTIASSMISVAGVTFSITIVALTLASNQFGPRLLRNFMRDRGNQIVLGTFLSAFLFCLLTLRQVHSGEEGKYDAFIPQVSILVAVLSAILGVGVLIYFIHHVAASIQASNVIAKVSDELHDAIERLYPKRIGEAPDEEQRQQEQLKREIPATFERDAAEVHVATSGYLRRIEADQLLEEAVAHNLLVRLERRPGQFLFADEVVLRAWPKSRVGDAVQDNLRQTFVTGSQRTLEQDAEFAIDQLVEIALLALSPGMNDAFTAMMVVDSLGTSLAHLAQRAAPSPYRIDRSGRLRVIASPRGFCKMFDAAFTQIRQNSAQNLAVMLRLFRTVRRIASHLPDSETRGHLRQFVDMVHRQAMSCASQEYDRSAVEKQYQASLETLE